ncbi:MAG: hypothetical protein ACE5I1_19055, partial [bacterium]
MLISFLAFTFSACEDPLEVENPNSLIEDDLADPSIGSGVANGALATLANAVGEMMSLTEMVSDEITFTGSRDGWRQLNQGNLTDQNNEFTDDAWQWIAEARWMADKAVQQLVEFDAAGTILNRSDLGRAYLYAATIRIYVADLFDNYVLSDRTEPAPPIGDANMFILYDDAISRLDKALEIAREVGDQELERQALSTRARAKYYKAVWQTLNPAGATPASPYVDAGADDAEAALALMENSWKWQLRYAATWGEGQNEFALWVNSRQEFAIVEPLPEDPIDGGVDARVQANVDEFTDFTANGGRDFSPHTVVSAHEMMLIGAEAALARGDEAAAKTTLNSLRSLDGLTALDAQVSVSELLQHERRANLFLHGRRMTDMY